MEDIKRFTKLIYKRLGQLEEALLRIAEDSIVMLVMLKLGLASDRNRPW